MADADGEGRDVIFGFASKFGEGGSFRLGPGDVDGLRKVD